ncbi:Nucleolin 1 [Heracleum sosnowskyi]|uniref:Nucleolin 1 n=1 Tax=Heracleum sosnowskyi TaxID=360622 RepID=A0AAD8MQ89_9APIA|nr:Nucleolin 1 [Heracleum sosnowskyi]
MGKSSKKSATKAAVAPAAAAATKPLKNGKREAEAVTEKQQVPAKKQKQNQAALKQAIAKKNAEAKIPKNTKAESGSEDDSDADDSGLEDDEIEIAPVSSKGEDDASEGESGEESGDDDSEDEEMPEGAEDEDGSSEEEGSEEEASGSEEEEEEEKTPKPIAKKATKTPSTPQAAATGGKTLFMGNLSFSVEESDVENFFKEAGEIAQIRLASDREGKFKGFGHVEFATAEAAQEALKLNGGDFLGRQVKLDLAREKGAYTPASGDDSHQKGGKPQGQTVFVRGFDTSDGEEQIRSALEKHFGSCGEIARVSIPQDREGGLKGMAYVEFKESNSTNKALKLNGSELGEGTLTVEEAKPRDNSSGRGGGRGGRFSGGGEVAVAVVVVGEDVEDTNLVWLHLAQEDNFLCQSRKDVVGLGSKQWFS